MFHAASDYGMVASMKLRDAARAIVESSLADVHARLRTHGVNVETFELQQEARYLEVEDELCRAAFEYDVRPSELDQSVFHSDGQ